MLVGYLWGQEYGLANTCKTIISTTPDRLPEHEGKENITGYSYEPWHFRYLGIDLATKVYKEGITFDEYYAYYIEK